jgi:hypothetical protein
MRFGPLSRLVLLLVLPISTLHAQAKPITATIGAGVLFADNGEQDLLSSRGATGFVRLNWRSSPLMLEASVQHVPRNDDIVFIAACPPAPASCTQAFIGPTTALTFAPALQFAERETRPSGVTVLVRVGPSLSWRVRRQDGSEPLAVGARAGMSVRLGTHGVLLSADIFRLFNAGSSPGWYLPITMGIEI